MKIKLAILGFGIAALVACGGNKTESSSSTEGTQEAKTETKAEVQGDDSAAQNGKQLMSKSDCMSCHADKSKIIGPAYSEVSAKYPATPENITLLANKIIKGGSGVWGEIPMTPHDQLSIEEASDMVKYILSIK